MVTARHVWGVVLMGLGALLTLAALQGTDDVDDWMIIVPAMALVGGGGVLLLQPPRRTDGDAPT